MTLRCGAGAFFPSSPGPRRPPLPRRGLQVLQAGAGLRGIRPVSGGRAGGRPRPAPAARRGLPARERGLLRGDGLLQPQLLRGQGDRGRGPAVRGAGRQRLQVGLPLLAGRGLGGLPLALQVFQAGQHPPGPRPRVRPRRHRVRAQQQVGAGQHRLVRVVVGGGLPGARHHLRGELPQPGLGPAGLLRGVRGDLDPVAGHHAPAAPAPRTRTREGPGRTGPPPARPARTGACGTGRTSCGPGSAARTRPGTSRRSGTGPPPPGWTAPRAGRRTSTRSAASPGHTGPGRPPTPSGPAAPAGRPGPAS